MKIKDRVGEREREKGVRFHFKYNLIIMQMPLKMSRLLWESVISMAIMSFMAHGERGRHRGTALS